MNTLSGKKHTYKTENFTSEQIAQALGFNKIPPHSIEFEREILGAILSDKNAIYLVMDLLHADDFYDINHQKIYTAMRLAFDHSHVPDTLTVGEYLNKMGCLAEIGGYFYLTQCTNWFSSIANLEAHCRIVLQKSIKRKTIRACAETMARMYQEDSDVFEVLDEHNETLYVNTSGVLVKQTITLPAIGKKFLEGVEKAWQNGMTGIPIGIPAIDKITKGLQPGNLAIIGARTRHGKSALAAAIMKYCSSFKDPEYPLNAKFESKFPAAFLSLEMQDTQLFARLVSAELKEMGHHIPYEKFNGGQDSMTEDEMKALFLAVERLATKSMYIDDNSELNQFSLKARIMKLVTTYGVKLVVIDYAQLMSNGASNKNTTAADSLSVIAKYCKVLAKLFNITIILLSQIDRDTEKREPRPPVLADLKGSGSLEESADYIFLCWRPEVWDPNAIDEETQMSERGMMWVHLAKNKNGKSIKVRIPFSVDTNSYGDMSIVEGYDTVSTYLNNRPIAI